MTNPYTPRKLKEGELLHKYKKKRERSIVKLVLTSERLSFYAYDQNSSNQPLIGEMLLGVDDVEIATRLNNKVAFEVVHKAKLGGRTAEYKFQCRNESERESWRAHICYAAKGGLPTDLNWACLQHEDKESIKRLQGSSSSSEGSGDSEQLRLPRHTPPVERPQQSSIPSWYFQNIDRDAGETVLNRSKQYGNLLVRPSVTKANCFALQFKGIDKRQDTHIFNFLLEQDHTRRFFLKLSVGEFPPQVIESAARGSPTLGEVVQFFISIAKFISSTTPVPMRTHDLRLLGVEENQYSSGSVQSLDGSSNSGTLPNSPDGSLSGFPVPAFLPPGVRPAGYPQGFAPASGYIGVPGPPPAGEGDYVEPSSLSAYPQAQLHVPAGYYDMRQQASPYGPQPNMQYPYLPMHGGYPGQQPLHPGQQPLHPDQIWSAPATSTMDPPYPTFHGARGRSDSASTSSRLKPVASKRGRDAPPPVPHTPRPTALGRSATMGSSFSSDQSSPSSSYADLSSPVGQGRVLTPSPRGSQNDLSQMSRQHPQPARRSGQGSSAKRTDQSISPSPSIQLRTPSQTSRHSPLAEGPGASSLQGSWQPAATQSSSQQHDDEGNERFSSLTDSIPDESPPAPPTTRGAHESWPPVPHFDPSANSDQPALNGVVADMSKLEVTSAGPGILDAPPPLPAL